jgi:hypothetical protein
MIAYNNEWLNNLLVRNEADNAADANCIDKAVKDNIYATYPVGFYTPNAFVRIGLFILTMIILGFSMGLSSLIFLSSAGEKGIAIEFIFFGLLSYGALEFMVNKNHYKSGVDDALMWTAGSYIVGGLNILVTISSQTNALLVFASAGFLFLRFTNRLMAVVASLALLAVIFFTIVRFGEMAKAFAPFVLMVASACIYFLAEQLSKDQKWKHYFNGLLMISTTALVCFYAAGNYFVVREASSAMFDLHLKDGESMPLGWLFWIFTIIIPVVYMICGVQKKDVVLLRVGLLLIAAIVFTVRIYYHILPAEIAMVIGGIIFIVIAYILIKYLDPSKYGFTSKEQTDKFFMDKLNVESLVIVQGFSGTNLPLTDNGTQFGGGTGGGGGASGEY